MYSDGAPVRAPLVDGSCRPVGWHKVASRGRGHCGRRATIFVEIPGGMRQAT
ncbi:hypothetical protein PSP6_70138 [Paraburkholderia tropica]|nr:hypothetical protein PSP6_70138 [Paraburkholderia tropica]